MPSNKIYIVVEGGVVTSVLASSDLSTLEVEVVDYDEGDGEEIVEEAQEEGFTEVY